MACYHPKTAYYSREKTNKGTSRLVFRKSDGLADGLFSVKVPCNRCIGCRLNYADDWATRCMLHHAVHEDGIFLTLTYAPEHLPKDVSLNHRDFQLFFKRLRKKFGNGISYYMCGEYGEKYKRPHYHAIVFGLKIPDAEHFFTRGEHKVYTSDSILACWKKGHISFGSVTWQSARYVARYIAKKVYGDSALEHYSRVDSETGEVYQVKSEYCQSSRGADKVIGRVFYQRYKSDMYPSDFVTVAGVKRRIPRYFDKLLEKDDPALLKSVKRARKVKAQNASPDYTDERLAVKEKIKYLDFQKFVKELVDV